MEMCIRDSYADVMERALYNGIISGMQLDGKRFFYVNPLETEPGVSGKLYGYKPVSYTHLDVYKRQPHVFMQI